MTTDPTIADPMSTLRRRTSEKWRTYPDDVLPMFVAEMDFPLAPAIKAALHEAVDLGDTGYVDPRGGDAVRAFSEYAEATWGWAPDPARMGITTDVSVVIVESLRRLIAPGDGVVITPPVYPPFYDMIAEGGGTVVEVPLLDDGSADRLDLAGIDAALAEPGLDAAGRESLWQARVDALQQAAGFVSTQRLLATQGYSDALLVSVD